MSGGARGIPPGLVPVFLALLPGLLGPAPGEAQFRRDAPLQAVSGVGRGDVLAGVGGAYAVGASFPLSGLSGDLMSIPELSLLYGLAERALIGLRGAAFQRLSIGERGDPLVPLDPGVDDGVTSDAGDFTITTSFAPLGSSRGFSAGGLVEVTLPNSDEKKGIGTNTTDVTVGLLGSWGAPRWRVSGLLGLAIAQAPVDAFEQNDLIAYAVDVLIEATRRLRVSVAVAGDANTRETVPVGTESRGTARALAEWCAGPWRLDASVGRGIAGTSPDWRLAAGVAWTATGEGH